MYIGRSDQSILLIMNGILPFHVGGVGLVAFANIFIIMLKDEWILF